MSTYAPINSSWLVCVAMAAHSHRLVDACSGCKLRSAGAPASIMCTFYRSTIKSVLTTCIKVWYGTCTMSCHISLQHIVRAAEISLVSLSLHWQHLHHPSQLQSSLHHKWSHPTIIREGQWVPGTGTGDIRTASSSRLNSLPTLSTF